MESEQPSISCTRNAALMKRKVFRPELYYDSSPESTYMELWLPVK